MFNNKGSWVIGSPVVDNGKLYFSTSDSGMFYALDAKTGAQVFSLEDDVANVFLPGHRRQYAVYRFG